MQNKKIKLVINAEIVPNSIGNIGHIANIVVQYATDIDRRNFYNDDNKPSANGHSIVQCVLIAAMVENSVEAHNEGRAHIDMMLGSTIKELERNVVNKIEVGTFL